MIKHLNKIISACLILFIFQLIYVFVYLNVHKHNFIKHYHEAIVQEITNLTQVAKSTDAAELEDMVHSFQNKRINLSLSRQPLSEPISLPYSYKHLNEVVTKHHDLIFLSFALPNKQWLNVQANLTASPPIWPHIVTLLIEMFFAMTLLFYAWSINRFVRPLKRFQLAATRLGVNLNATPLDEFKGPSIIRETAHAMNIMQKRIKDLLSDRTLMIAAMSHDLRTPITRMSLRLQLLEDSDFKQKTLNDLQEMSALISEVLVFSRNESTIEESRKFEINAFIETLCSSLQDLDFKVQFLRAPRTINLAIKEVTLKRALNNIIQNACKYGTEATVSIRETDLDVLIIIEDKGDGIAEEEITQVFSPFYRVEKSRNRKISGTGLGLAISRSAINAHHGDIKLENMKPRGLRVTVNLPKKTTKAS